MAFCWNLMVIYLSSPLPLVPDKIRLSCHWLARQGVNSVPTRWTLPERFSTSFIFFSKPFFFLGIALSSAKSFSNLISIKIKVKITNKFRLQAKEDVKFARKSFYLLAASQRISFQSLIKNCNHKCLGIYYLLSAFIFGISGTLISVLIRIELYSTGNRIISPEKEKWKGIHFVSEHFIECVV